MYPWRRLESAWEAFREASSGEPVIIGRRGADQVILPSQEEYE